MDPENNGGGVQPGADPGQGGGGDTDGLYDAVLNAVPEASHEAVRAALKEMEGGVTRRFQEHADFRRQWEPYSEQGLDQVQPDELAALVSFHQLLSSPDALTDAMQDQGIRGEIEGWWEQIGNAAGFFADEGGDEGGEPGGQEQLAEALMAQLEQRLAPIEQRLTAQDQQGRVQAARDEIDATIAELTEQHGDFDEDAVLRLAQSHDGSAAESIQAAFRDYQTIAGKAESELVNDKLGQPATPEQGGAPDTTPEAITSFEDAGKAALRRLAGANAT